MQETILITGATGNVGREVVRELQGRARVRAAAFNVDEARATLGGDVEIVAFDFLKPETFGAAFAGVDRLFLVRPPALSNVQRDIAPALQAARAAGVRHVVFLSLQGVENNRITPHYKIEQVLLQTSMDWTFLRSGFFMQNLNTTHRAEIRDRSEIFVPAGRSKTAFVDVRDLGAVAARVLAEPGHENKTYTLTGSEALDYDAVAGVLSDVLARPIVYKRPSLLRFVFMQIRRGTRPAFALIMGFLYTITRMGNAAEVSPDVEQLLGRPPTSLRQYAADYRGSWTP